MTVSRTRPRSPSRTSPPPRSGDFQGGQFFYPIDLPEQPDGVLGLQLGDMAGGDFQVGGGDGPGDIAGGEAVGREPLPVEGNQDLPFLPTYDLGVGHPPDPGQLGDNRVLGQQVKVPGRPVPGDRQLHNRHGVDIELLDQGFFRAVGEVGLDQRHLIPDVGRRHVNILIQFELEHNQGNPLAGDGLDVLESFRGAQFLFQRLAEQGLDLPRPGPRINGGDGDEGEFHLGKEVDREPEIGHQAEQDHDQNDHGHQNPALD